jgi:hypothetical protein
VVQTYDTETKKWTGQEFIAGDQVDYEFYNGDPANPDDVTGYLPFDMVQPQ